jgi:DNA repair protein RecO (recombination protein O)
VAPEEDQAYLLHRRPYRESSLLLEMLCADHGRLGMVARGALRRGRWGGLLQPFAPLRVSWSGRGELGSLRACEPLPGAARPAPDRLAYGLYLNELVQRLLPRGLESGGLYPGYEAAVRALGRGEDARRVLLDFELCLLRALGHELTAVDDQGLPLRLEPAARYHYRPLEGLKRGTGSGAWASGAALSALTEGLPEDSGQRMELERLVEGTVQSLLGGRPLRAARLLPRNPRP